ncbi:hypothetical protein NP233_g3093 [Leucocoprinus birnbaumii]|uniref:F-box domain-containing protein n=1 Tax=Leucocoprinus birnbaumii TaxID=56174 RepID=A0AAD5VX51_9AGAR|nr:hypothetical protein NP233_g3093 [Leucocoprinus birnbaumii]
MHRCLSIPEVLTLICEEFYNESPVQLPSQAQDASTLASLARTSRSWSEPALEVLWRSIHGLGTLFPELENLLPEGDGWEKQRLIRRLTAGDMKSFTRNAARIRVFAESTDKDNALYSVLFGYGYTSCLLPNLRKLEWEVSTPEDFPYIRLLICPNLEVLRLLISYDIVFEQLNVLGALSSETPTAGNLPNLSRLSLGLNNPRKSQFPNVPFARQELLNVLRPWSQLTDLDLDEMPLESMRCIIHMPNLKKFRFSAELKPPSRPLPNPFHSQALLSSPDTIEPPCPLLADISVEHVPPSVVNTMLEALVHVHLKHLELAFYSNKDPKDPNEDSMNFLNNLDRYVDPITLESISISWVDYDLQFRACVLPLLKFNQLRDVSLDASPFKSIPELPMSQVATSWPLIESLHILSFEAWLGMAHSPLEATSSFTLLSLIPLAQNCRSLRSLKLTMAADDAETREIIQRNPYIFQGVKNSSLRKLLPDESRVADEEFVASFLSNIFPALDEVDYNTYSTSEGKLNSHQKGWRRVGELLQALNQEKRLRKSGQSVSGM